jgi:hypothetical protein
MDEFFVTCWDAETGRKAKLAGPFATHDDALAAVEPARKSACDKYPAAHWFYFGTAKVTI